MVGPLLLLKMLHCKKKCQNLCRQEQSSFQRQMESPDTSKAHSPKQTTCRICLKEGDIPIYGKKAEDGIPEALITIGGIEIEEGDAHPKHLCHSCNALLQGAILFRKTAQQSEEILKKPIKTQPDSDDDINTDDDNTFRFTEIEKTFLKKKEYKTYHCQRCDINFENFSDYNDHKLTEDHENKRLTCPICHNSYTALYIKKHLSLHKKETLHVCDICGKKFVIQGHFKRHRLTHFYELPYKCSLCPYRGRFSESLKMHMRTHTGEKPYQCSECSARFVNKSNLNKHARTHTGEYDHKCENCGRGFYSKRTLDLHIKVDHTGVKDHVCNICFKAFGYRKQMMKHQLKVHKRQKLRSGRLPLYLQVEKMKDMQES